MTLDYEQWCQNITTLSGHIADRILAEDAVDLLFCTLHAHVMNFVEKWETVVLILYCIVLSMLGEA